MEYVAAGNAAGSFNLLAHYISTAPGFLCGRNLGRCGKGRSSRPGPKCSSYHDTLSSKLCVLTRRVWGVPEGISCDFFLLQILLLGLLEEGLLYLVGPH